MSDVDVKEVVKRVADLCGFAPEDIESGRRGKGDVTRARALVWLTLRDVYGWKFEDIAARFGRDHNTIQVGIRNLRKLERDGLEAHRRINALSRRAG